MAYVPPVCPVMDTSASRYSAFSVANAARTGPTPVVPPTNVDVSVTLTIPGAVIGPTRLFWAVSVTEFVFVYGPAVPANADGRQRLPLRAG